MNMSSQSTGPLPDGHLLAGRYLIEGQLGQGGFGLIYKARDTRLRNKLIAIKQISLSRLSPQEMIEATDSFNREVTMLSQLRHASLPRIYNQFTDPDHWYVVMDYIQGETLEDMLKRVRGGCFPAKRVATFGITLCDVLSYLHSQHPPIIFRDVKPANIMMARDGHLYLIDFGIARQYRFGQKKDTGALGSPGYAAPEQYGRAQTTAQTDIYGLGATLQTLLTGKDPLDIAVDGIPADHPVPRRLQPLIAHMLERDPKARPASMDEVKARLVAFRDHTPGQILRRGLRETPRTLKAALSGFTIPILLFVALIFWFFDLNLGFSASPLWLPCLLTCLFVVCLYLASGLFEGVLRPASKMRVSEIILLLWERLLTSLFVSAILTLLFYFLQDILHHGQMWTLELPALILGVCCGAAFFILKLSALIRAISRKGKSPANQLQEEMPILVKQPVLRSGIRGPVRW
jgi:hypothetical protein